MATIADKLTTIAGIKTDIRTAINGKGGSLTSGSPFSAYSAAISSLPSGGGGGASSTDWSQIGYTGAPQAVQDAFSHARTIYDNWNPTTTRAEYKFSGDTNLVYMPMVDTSRVVSTNGLFWGCANLTVVPLLDTSSLTSMQDMFRDCASLSAVPLFDTSSVTVMTGAFKGCTNLSVVPLLNTSACTSMSGTFSTCYSLKDVPALNTSACTNMKSMFGSCSGLTSIPAFNTSACTNMNKMFYKCSGLTSVPLFDTSSVTDMGSMFESCSSLTGIPALNTSKASNMGGMFNGCSSLQKITSLDMDKCTSFRDMLSSSWPNQGNLRFILLKGLGTPSGTTSYADTRMEKCTNWGVGSNEIPDARQSLVDSLLTYSFDRAAAGYATCTIKLSSNSYNQLTPQELADIQAKGYNITT